MAPLTMPRLSDSMEEGTIARWLKRDGDTVARGEEVVEIETDKATMAYESDAEGVLAILAAEGETVPVGAPIATVGAPGDDGATAVEHMPAAQSAPTAAEAPAAEHARAAAASPAAAAAPRVPSASPVARRTAARLGVALDGLRGSGPRGRVLKADVTAAAAAGAAPPQAAGSAKGRVTAVPTSRLQELVARRMSESKATAPDFALEVDVDMTAAIELRAQLKQVASPPPSLNDLLVKAVALAARAHPRVNGSFQAGRFELYERVNVGVAVAADDGLVVPTVLDADRRPLGELAAELRRLAERVRSGTVTPPELAGGTITVSNLGMLGVDRFAGVLNPPQAAIVCAGAVRRRPAVTPGGDVAARETMTLTLVSDHRILYGADAARFLTAVRDRLEAPVGLLL